MGRVITSMDDEARELENAEVFRNRYRDARRAGLPPDDALTFAQSFQDVGELRHLIELGCPVEQLRRIVL